MAAPRISSRIVSPPGWLDMPLLGTLGFNDNRSPRSMRPHSHDVCEITYAFSGEVTWETAEAQILRLTAGRLGITQPHIQHGSRYDTVTPATFAWAQLRPDAPDAGRHSVFSAADLEELQHILQAAGNTVVPGSQGLQLCLSQLHPLLSQALAGQTLDALLLHRARALVCQLVSEAAACLRSASGDGPVDPSADAVQQACDYIQRRLSQAPSVPALAEYLGLSASRLHVIFKAGTGMTPVDYWHRRRCDRAMERLLETDTPITRIAHELGYASSQYFATTFRKYQGQSPSSFRAAHRAGN